MRIQTVGHPVGDDDNERNLRLLTKFVQSKGGADLVPFVGAGISQPYGYKMWTEFLEERGRLNKIEAKIAERVRLGEHAYAAQDILSEEGRTTFREAIADEYREEKLNRIVIRGVAKLLPQLISGPVITTNFDRVLETAFSRAQCPFKTTVYGAKMQIAVTSMRHNDRVLIKIHGDVEDNSDMVLTKEDYDKHYRNRGKKVDIKKPLPKLLDHILRDRCLLFLGCSLTNDVTMEVLESVCSHFDHVTHYAIIEAPVDINDFLKRRTFLANYHIRPIWFPTGQFKVIEDILRQLIRASKSINHEVVQTKPPPQKTAGKLPLGMTSFVGRVGDKTTIKRLLQHNRVVTLIGMGGIGKTRLAIQVADDLKCEYSGGTYFVQLATLMPTMSSLPLLIYQEIASALNIKEKKHEPISNTILSFLRQKTILIIFDNCEHILADCRMVIDVILKGCPYLHILATSREPINTSWQSYSVHPLRQPLQSETYTEIVRNDAVKIFVSRAKLIIPNFKLTQANAMEVADICCQLDCIPLAIELAAARIDFTDITHIRSDLVARFKYLVDGNPSEDPRHMTLKATMDWSFDLLGQNEKDLFADLSIFSGGWSIDVLPYIQIEGASKSVSMRSDDNVKWLMSLVRKSLVVRSSSGDRFQMLKTVQEYGMDYLMSKGQVNRANQQHFEFCLALAEQAEGHLMGHDQDAWLHRLDDEQDNLRQALSSVPESVEVNARLRLAGALGRYWDIRGYYAEGRDILDKAIVAAGEGGSKEFAKAAYWAGMLAFNQGDYNAANSYEKDCLRISLEISDEKGIATAQSGLGRIAYRKGDYVSARFYYEESLSIWRQLGDKNGIADIVTSLGSAAFYQGDYESARKFYEQSLEIRQELGDQSGIAYSLNGLANVDCFTDNFVTAKELYLRSLAIRRQLQDASGIASVEHGLAIAALGLHDYGEAHQLVKSSLASRRQVKDKQGEANALQTLGAIYFGEGNYVEARDHFKESLSLRKIVGDQDGIANSLNSLGRVEYKLAQYRTALSYFLRGLLAWQELGKQIGGDNDAKDILIWSTGEYRQARKGWGQAIIGIAYVAMKLSKLSEAAQLYGVVAVLDQSISNLLSPIDRKEYESNIDELREHLTADSFASILSHASSITLEQVVQLVHSLE